MQAQLWPAVLPVLDAEAVPRSSLNLSSSYRFHSFAGQFALDSGTEAKQATSIPITMAAGAADAVAGSPGTQELPIPEAGVYLQAMGCVASAGSKSPLDRNASLETSTTLFDLPGTLAASDTCLAGPSAGKKSAGKKSRGKKAPGKKSRGKKSPVKKSPGKKRTRTTGIGNPA
jgi:hypothetical protein